MHIFLIFASFVCLYHITTHTNTAYTLQSYLASKIMKTSAKSGALLLFWFDNGNRKKIFFKMKNLNLFLLVCIYFMANANVYRGLENSSQNYPSTFFTKRIVLHQRA